LPNGGTIEISTASVTLDESVASANPEARPGHFVCLSVVDRGCGMTPQVLARIFDPFFTTKDVGKGTGLGLSTIHGIVKQHEGWIDVASEVGRGSTFNIFLPACHMKAPAPEPVQVELHSAEAGRGETILVVEDENAVRELASASLQKLGYRVLKAANGPQAIEVWELNDGRVDLLLTDMVMPSGMSGGELAKILQSRNTRLKVIYTTGYSPEVLRKDSGLAKGVNFLPKPYDTQTLHKTVKTCLDSGRPAYQEDLEREVESTASQP
jgi:CheY-like chemotaxis protein